MTAKYASKTKVPEDRSRAEIERLVFKYAGRDTNFSYGQMAGLAMIMFVTHSRRVKFTLPLPTNEEAAQKAGRKDKLQTPSQSVQQAWIDRERRRRWRALLLSIKGKLESVESGIAIFEQEFLGNIVPEGTDQTIYEHVLSGHDKKLLGPLQLQLEPVKELDRKSRR